MKPMFNVIQTGDGHFIKAWNRGVVFEDKALEQLANSSRLPFIFKYIAAMPDAHWGMGSTVGSVIPTLGAICPATVGVDIGCGMMAVRLDKKPNISDLPALRALLEKSIPAGRTNNGAQGDRGAWHDVPAHIQNQWDSFFAEEYEALCTKHPKMRARNTANHLGTLGTGNHFLELCRDENGEVWVVLHSGSRGMGNRIGTYFTELAKKLCAEWFVTLPDPNLAYLPQHSDEFADYKCAVQLAQRFAWANREAMMNTALNVLGAEASETVHCHHNYIAWEHHFGVNVMVTRKGAVRAQLGDMGIIPGSMGARTYIVRGLGSTDSFCSCSHGAGRAMGRREAKKRFSVEEHAAATLGVECDKTAETLDETPGAYKDIEAVMAAQADLVEPVYRLKQFLCMKGVGE